MLQLIRDRAQGFVVGVIVLFICLTFALWGIDEYVGAGGAVVVAEVNGDEVELGEFQRMFQRIRQQAQILYGEQFNEAQWTGEQAKLSTLDQVVDERVLLGLASDANMRISNRQVFEQIRNNDQFAMRPAIFPRKPTPGSLVTWGLTKSASNNKCGATYY